jgi:hypothetical protein
MAHDKFGGAVHFGTTMIQRIDRSKDEAGAGDRARTRERRDYRHIGAMPSRRAVVPFVNDGGP